MCSWHWAHPNLWRTRPNQLRACGRCHYRRIRSLFLHVHLRRQLSRQHRCRPASRRYLGGSYAAIFAPSRERGSELPPLIATIGVSVLLQNVMLLPGYSRVADQAVLTRAMIKDMFWATCISISVVSAVNVLLLVWGAL